MSFPKFIKILGFELQAEGNIQKCHTCDHLYFLSQWKIRLLTENITTKWTENSCTQKNEIAFLYSLMKNRHCFIIRQICQTVKIPFYVYFVQMIL